MLQVICGLIKDQEGALGEHELGKSQPGLFSSAQYIHLQHAAVSVCPSEYDALTFECPGYAINCQEPVYSIQPLDHANVILISDTSWAVRAESLQTVLFFVFCINGVNRFAAQPEF